MKTTELVSQLKAQTEKIIIAVETQFSSLPDEQLNYKPAADSWSILECFEHLNLYNQYYLTASETAITKAGGNSAPELKHTWIGKKSIAMMHPSNTKKQKTFKKMIPSRSKLNRDVLATFLNDQQRILRLLQKSLSVDVTKSLVPVEFFKLLKMNIAETIEFVIVHEERHLLQGQRVLKQLQTSQPVLSV
jgi:hypothetical protein